MTASKTNFLFLFVNSIHSHEKELTMHKFILSLILSFSVFCFFPHSNLYLQQATTPEIADTSPDIEIIEEDEEEDIVDTEEESEEVEEAEEEEPEEEPEEIETVEPDDVEEVEELEEPTEPEETETVEPDEEVEVEEPKEPEDVETVEPEEELEEAEEIETLEPDEEEEVEPEEVEEVEEEAEEDLPDEDLDEDDEVELDEPIEPDDEIEVDEPTEDDDLIDDEILATTGTLTGIDYAKLIDTEALLSVIRESFGRLAQGLATGLSKAIKTSAQRSQSFMADLQKGIVRIPNIGMFKFKKVTKKTLAAEIEALEEAEDEDEDEPEGDDEDEEGDVQGADKDNEPQEDKTPPLLEGILYDKKGRKPRQLTAGPFEISLLKVMIYPLPAKPRIFCYLKFFKYRATLKQKQFVEGATEFLLTMTPRPFRFPIGLKRHFLINKFTLRLTPEEKILFTEARIFGTANEKPSKIKLNCTEQPFTFQVTSENIPITAIMKPLGKTPFKNIVLKKSTLSATLIPPSIKLVATADISSIKIPGMSFQQTTAKATANLSTAGPSLNITIKKVPLPLGLGMIDTGVLQIGSPAE